MMVDVENAVVVLMAVMDDMVEVMVEGVIEAVVMPAMAMVMTGRDFESYAIHLRILRSVYFRCI